MKRLVLTLILLAPLGAGPAPSKVATGKAAMAATAHPLATEAALKTLKAGGNAVDAAVAASFVISVVRPQSTGIGGGGFLLSHDAKAGKTEVYDFRERAPAAATRNMYLDATGNPVPELSTDGHLAVGIPGLVKGLLEVHAAHGSRPLSELLAPAIAAADEGFPVYGGLAEALTERAEVIKRFPSTVRIFFKDGRPLKVGETLVQKDLARTLRLIAKDGAKAFYEGDVARLIEEEMKRGGGILTRKDLASYTVKKREPVVGSYRGHTVISMPPPSSGGAHILQIMGIISKDDYGKLGFGTTASVHLLAEAMRRAFADRAEYLGDPDFVKIPLRGLLDARYHAKLRASIDLRKATPSSSVKPGNPAAYESPSTTHLSIVDAKGNAVSTTQTVNYSLGSCVVAEGTGIVLNDEMDDFSVKPGVPNVFGLVGAEANAVAASKTMLSSMSPTIVLGPDKKLRLVVGSPGGPRIISATLQTILNVVDHKMPLGEAVHATRIHHQWLPDELRVEEGGLARAVLLALKEMGHNVVAKKGPIGDVQAVGVEAGVVTGVSDTRSEGVPMGF